MHKLAMLLLPLVLSAAELPVREVVLYKNGVGYFIRAGEVKPTEPVRLEFREAEMNDVLKSLTVSDRGGTVTQLRYDSNEPIDRKLSEFPFALSDKLTLAAFLDRLKGARVEIRFGPDTLSGAIISGRNAPAEKDRGERDMLVLLLDGGELRTVDLAASQSIRFADPLVQKQLVGFLGALNQARSREKRAVYIDGTGSGSRQITASYMVSSPVWKSSYRLLFGDQAKPVLEGWAIVDNTSGDDWANIRLALVSGRPVSFISRLYDPKYIERQSAELAETASIAPVVHEGAMESVTVAAAAPMAAPEAATFKSLQRFAQLGRAPMAQMVAGVADAQPAVDSSEVGDLFEYRFATPVTIKRGESAMLPFLQEGISARRLLIYSSGLNPLNAAELTNNTGKTLDGGPITVFDGRSYAGEALMETSKAGDKRLISYAVDLGTRITTAFDSSSDVIREIHVRRGILTTRSALQETRTYTIKNVDQKPKTLVIEHGVRPDYKLLNQKPAETTPHAYRFEVKLAAGTAQKFPVTEEHVYDNSIAIVSFTPDVLAIYIQNKALSDNGRRQLERIAAKKQEIAVNDAALRRAQGDSNELVSDQNRLRQNIDSLNRVSGQQDRVQQYARDLSNSESKLAALRDQRRGLEQKKVELENDLNAQIESADF
jgi:hypothetical protein